MCSSDLECLKAAEELEARGLSTTVADARFAKPLDRDLILRLAREHEALITIEEGAVGGFGSHVLQLLATEGMLDHGLKIRPMVFPDIFIDQDKPVKMYDVAAMNAPHIVETALRALGEEAADGLVGGQGHELVAVWAFGAVILPLEGDALVVEGDEAAVSDGDAVGVARQVGEHGLGPGEGPLGVDHPLDLA